jgi:glycosyltransferase involved in cell wall biosynthesis
MNGKRIIQVVKTFDGALWALEQVSQLVKLGWEIHIFSPTQEGRYSDGWKKSGATLHTIDTEFPAKAPWKIAKKVISIREKVLDIKPDLIHSHFVSTTLMLRSALRGYKIPRVFQVPGPLHLEKSIFGQWETFSADADDYWIASSDYIRQKYERVYGIDPSRLFLSYYGTDLRTFKAGEPGEFRKKFSIPSDATVVGNVSFIYPPKLYLGQRVGLKGHELMIESLGALMKDNPKLYGVFIGNQWGTSQAYYEKLKSHALSLSERFIFTGFLPQQEIARSWRDFDLALHLPSSENCGGVIEPLLNGVPVVASTVGGLPEIIIPGKTGYLAQSRTIDDVEIVIRNALSDRPESERLACNGKRLVERNFNVINTASEIDKIYKKILGSKNYTSDF